MTNKACAMRGRPAKSRMHQATHARSTPNSVTRNGDFSRKKWRFCKNSSGNSDSKPKHNLLVLDLCRTTAKMLLRYCLSRLSRKTFGISAPKLIVRQRCSTNLQVFFSENMIKSKHGGLWNPFFFRIMINSTFSSF